MRLTIFIIFLIVFDANSPELSWKKNCIVDLVVEFRDRDAVVDRNYRGIFAISLPLGFYSLWSYTSIYLGFNILQRSIKRLRTDTAAFKGIAFKIIYLYTHRILLCCSYLSCGFVYFIFSIFLMFVEESPRDQLFV